jgi:glycerol-3-phosphate dehydrogenase
MEEIRMGACVAVIGAGVAGLSVTSVVAGAGYNVFAFDKNANLGSQTSTQNHGWLHHSGRFYLLKHGTEALFQCHEGAREILTLAPGCVGPTKGSYVVTADMCTAERYVSVCRDLGLADGQVSVEKLRKNELALTSSPIVAAFKVTDQPFSPTKVLKVLAAKAQHAGAEIRCGTKVQGFRTQGESITHVIHSAENGIVEETAVDFVVNAAGAWSRRVLELAGIEFPDIHIFKSSLLVVEPAFTRLMLLSLDDKGATIVPHGRRTLVGVNGDAQKLLAPLDDHAVDQQSIDILLDGLREMMPVVLRDKARRARVWSCQKTEFVGHGNSRGRSPTYALLDHSENGIENLLTCIPGKFTVAPLMARAVLNKVHEKLPLHERPFGIGA